jgi:hypothetical protein
MKFIDDLKIQPMIFKKYLQRMLPFTSGQFNRTDLDDPDKTDEAFAKHFYIAYSHNNTGPKVCHVPFSLLIYFC